MKVVQINAVYGCKSTGTIMRQLQDACLARGIDAFVTYSWADRPYTEIRNGYHIGNCLTEKVHAFLSRIAGKQGYFNRFTTWLFLRYLSRLEPDIVHLHNLHSNYIHLNSLLRFLGKNDIRTIITLHDCWFFTGGCFHYSSVNCQRWKYECGNCPKRRKDTPAYFVDASSSILQDRKKYLNSIPRLTIIGASKWVSEECGQSILKTRDIRFIHNGFDFSIFRPTESTWKKQLGIEGKYVILGPASKWYQEINHSTFDFFVQSMDESMVLVLFGGRPNHVPESKKVVHIDYIQNAYDMAAVYSMADIMVNCSREDTLSSLNIECQACGTPVVTYEATGNKETVDGVCSLAVESGNYEDLFFAMLTIREKGKGNLSSGCISWVNQEFSYCDFIDKYISLYEEGNK